MSYVNVRLGLFLLLQLGFFTLNLILHLHTPILIIITLFLDLALFLDIALILDIALFLSVLSLRSFSLISLPLSHTVSFSLIPLSFLSLSVSLSIWFVLDRDTHPLVRP